MGTSRTVTGPKHGARPDGTDPAPARPDRPGRLRGWVLALSGTVVAGLVVLALGLVLVWAVVGVAGSPGPGPVMLVGHVLGAGLAVFLHRTALRRADALGWAAAFGAPGVLLVLGLLFWWN